MKKLYIGAIAGVAAISLVACDNSAAPTEGTTETSELTLQEVYTKTLERQESLDSVKASISMDQSTELSGEGENFTLTSTSNLDMSLTANPLAFFVDGTMSMGVPGEEEEDFTMPVSMYFTETDGFYMNDGMSDSWVKLPDELFEDILAQAGASADATEQLKQLQPFIDDFTFTQTNSEYILTLKAAGDKFKELIMEQMNTSLGETLGEVETDAFNQMTFDETEYVLTIDKKTFDLTKMDMKMSMNTAMEGMTMKINSASTILYTEFNSIGEIVIPQTIIDTAVESPF